MSYNILCGGLPIRGGADRQDAIAQVIRAANPDILALQECVGFEAPYAMDRWAARLGLQYYAIAPAAPYEDGYRYNITVFSRFFVQKTHVFAGEGFQSAGLAAEIGAPAGVLRLCNLHLHAFDETARLAELRQVLTHDYDVIAGDLNAISRTDSYADTGGEFERAFALTEMLGQQGYRDLGAGAGLTHPSRLPADHTRQISRRIDYIWARERTDRAHVIRDDLAHQASDHFPLWVDLD